MLGAMANVFQDYFMNISLRERECSVFDGYSVESTSNHCHGKTTENEILRSRTYVNNNNNNNNR